MAWIKILTNEKILPFICFPCAENNFFFDFYIFLILRFYSLAVNRKEKHLGTEYYTNKCNSRGLNSIAVPLVCQFTLVYIIFEYLNS